MYTYIQRGSRDPEEYISAKYISGAAGFRIDAAQVKESRQGGGKSVRIYVSQHA